MASILAEGRGSRLRESCANCIVIPFLKGLRGVLLLMAWTTAFWREVGLTSLNRSEQAAPAAFAALWNCGSAIGSRATTGTAPAAEWSFRAARSSCAEG